MLINSEYMPSTCICFRHPELQDQEMIEKDLAPPITIAFLPFFHAYGMVAIMLGGLFGGGTIITLPRFVPEQFLATIEKYKVLNIKN